VALTYNLLFSDTTKPGFSIFPFTTNGPISPSNPTLIENAVTARTTLKLYGRGLSNFGEAVAQNFVYMIENFASPTRPVNSIEGQLWYSTNNGSPPSSSLFIRNNSPDDTAGGPGWDGIITATGSTPMQGELLLFGNPTTNLGAVPKQYVDTHISDNALHLSPIQNTFLDNLSLTGSPTTLTASDVNQLEGITSNVQLQLNNKLNLSGGVIAGNLVISGGIITGIPALPTLADEVASKAYVDFSVLTGGVSSGDGVLNSANFVAATPGPFVVSDTTLEFTVLVPGSPPSTNTLTVEGISRVGHTHTASDLTNVPAGNISAIDIQAAINELDVEKAPLNNPIFTGNITGNAATFTGSVQGITPVLDAEFATKQYSDLKISRSGDTMDLAATFTLDGGQLQITNGSDIVITGGGTITGVPLLPVAPDEAASKSYVDTTTALHSESFFIDVDTTGAVMTNNTLPIGWTTTYIGVGNFTITHNLASTEPGFALLVLYNGTARVLNPTVINSNDISFQITDTLNAAVEGRTIGKLLFI